MGYVEPSIGGLLDAGNVSAAISARRRRNSAASECHGASSAHYTDRLLSVTRALIRAVRGA
eukprot:2295125-Prymnesium_polylepis.1